MEQKIRVVVKRAGQDATVEMVEDTLQTYQEIVGGWIEVVECGKGVAMVCNEEGKIDGLDANLMFPDDIIVGDVLFCGVRDGDMVSLTDKQVQAVQRLIAERAL
jgi:hypothetical protein